LVAHIKGKESEMNSELLTPAEASEYTRISEGAMKMLRYTGKGPTYLKPTAKTVLYMRSSLDDWLLASERTSTAEALAG
jgi:hypothetical protein